MDIRNICVYCGSSFGLEPEYRTAAKALGTALAEEGWNLVYGGGDRGLMGEIALEMRNRGRHITGYTTKRFHKDSDDEWPAEEFEVFDTMHERKMKMFLESDAFIALPGGMGTLEELSELITWRQIKYTNKPFVLFNLGGFWNGLVMQMETMVKHGFTKPEQYQKLKICSTPEEIIAYLRDYRYEDAMYEIKK